MESMQPSKLDFVTIFDDMGIGLGFMCVFYLKMSINSTV